MYFFVLPSLKLHRKKRTETYCLQLRLYELWNEKLCVLFSVLVSSGDLVPWSGGMVMLGQARVISSVVFTNNFLCICLVWFCLYQKLLYNSFFSVQFKCTLCVLFIQQTDMCEVIRNRSSTVKSYFKQIKVDHFINFLILRSFSFKCWNYRPNLIISNKKSTW